MPNWCYTTYNIEGPQKEIEALKAGIDKAVEKKEKSVGFDKWLGYLLMHAKGISLEEASFGDHECRGEISEMYENTPNELTVVTSTAWVPMHEAMVAMKHVYAPTSKIYYSAEEPGNGIYETNEPDCGDYYLDIWNPEDIPSAIINLATPYVTENDLRKALQKALKSKEKNIDELIEETEDLYGDCMEISLVTFCEID